MKYLLQTTIITLTLFITIGSQVAYGISNCYCTGDVPLLIQNTKECCESDHGTLNGKYCQLAASNGDAEKKWKECCVRSPVGAPIVTTGICFEH